MRLSHAPTLWPRLEKGKPSVRAGGEAACRSGPGPRGDCLAEIALAGCSTAITGALSVYNYRHEVQSWISSGGVTYGASDSSQTGTWSGDGNVRCGNYM